MAEQERLLPAIQPSPPVTYWDKIAAIEYAGEAQTYDLTVPDTHNCRQRHPRPQPHAADYAVLTCQTASLPARVHGALMSVHRDDLPRSAFAADCNRMGIAAAAHRQQQRA